MKPSFIAQALSGLLIAWALYIVIMNIESTELPGLGAAKILLFFSSAIALHGMLHMWAEIYYRYNPLETGKFYY